MADEAAIAVSRNRSAADERAYFQMTESEREFIFGCEQGPLMVKVRRAGAIVDDMCDPLSGGMLDYCETEL